MIAAINKGISALGAALLFALMMLTVVDVFGRSVLNRPLPGASELTEIALAGIVFLLLPRVSFRRQHIAVDLIGRKASGSLRLALDVAGAVTGCIVFVLIAWRLGYLAVTAGRYNDVTATLGLPLAPIFWVIAVLAAVAALAFLATIPQAFRQAGRADASVSSDTSGDS